MIKLAESGVFIKDGQEIIVAGENSALTARQHTMTYKILAAHNHSANMERLQLKFDVLTSHDLTYVGVIQTARASGMKKFPIPYVLTNCHNSLCAVGGTLNEDDHIFALTAAQKYGGIYVPAHLAVIHQYMRECWAECGSMILGSDSHTRYGALGSLAIGEGGGELAKQLLEKTYDINYPEVIAIKLTGKLRAGVGPQDIALAIIGAVFKNNYVNNKVMEFIGDGIENLSVEFRNGIDVMTTETTCLSSIWCTDDKVKQYYRLHGRKTAYQKLQPGTLAYYDGLVEVDLAKIEPMIAMPCHPSNVYTIREVQENPEKIIAQVENQAAVEGINLKLQHKIIAGKLQVQQGIIAGCAGGSFSNIEQAAKILENQNLGNGEFSLSIYPSSQPVYLELVKNGSASKLMEAGAIIKTAFCGPCFGAGDTPANDTLSVRHTTRNFPNREGSQPGEGQMAAVALMDARSIAATALNGGYLSSALELEFTETEAEYEFSSGVYDNRVYNGWGNAKPEIELRLGPGITDWPKMKSLDDHLLLKVCAFINDHVTTTDELIPSGEAATFRSNPEKMAKFTLSRRDPEYVRKAMQVRELVNNYSNTQDTKDAKWQLVIESIKEKFATLDINNLTIGSTIYANKPGDGSAREQAASCQKVLGGWANIAREYATKRYRSNLINWGMIPFLVKELPVFKNDEYIFIPDIKRGINSGQEQVEAYLVQNNFQKIILYLPKLTIEERAIIQAGSLINYYRA